MQDNMQNRGAVPRSGSIGTLEKPVDPQLSAHLERFRRLLGPWTEPILLAYGKYARAPKQAAFESLLKVCCEAARQIAQANGAALAALSRAEFTYRMNVGEDAPPVGARVAFESGFPGACLKSRQAFLSNHVSMDLRVDPAVRQRGIKSLIAVPMVKKGEVLGFFEVVSRDENHFTVSHVVSLQFIAGLVGGLLSDLRPANGNTSTADSRERRAATEPPRKNESEPPNSLVSSNSRPAIKEKTANVVSSVSSMAIPASETPAGQGRSEPQPAPPANSSAKSIPATPASPKATEPLPGITSGAATLPTERRSRARTLVDCLAYVSLGEENGGILLDINDAGFCMQTALPLDPGTGRPRRARLTGNGDFEADCELIWEQARQAGFRFLNLSAEMRLKLQPWIAANGNAPLSECSAGE